MKKLLLLPFILLAVSANSQGMWRARQATPKVARPAKAAPKFHSPVSCEKVAQIKKQYPLPNALSGSEQVHKLTAPQLKTHLRYEQLCVKASLRDGASERAKDHAKTAAKKCATVFLAPVITAMLMTNSVDALSTGLFATACGYSLYNGPKALEDIRQAVHEYKQVNKKKQTIQDELAALVAEQKFQFKVPYDIQ